MLRRNGTGCCAILHKDEKGWRADRRAAAAGLRPPPGQSLPYFDREQASGARPYDAGCRDHGIHALRKIYDADYF